MTVFWHGSRDSHIEGWAVVFFSSAHGLDTSLQEIFYWLMAAQPGLYHDSMYGRLVQHINSGDATLNTLAANSSGNALHGGGGHVTFEELRCLEVQE